MNIKGIIIPGKNYSNTVKTTEFALRYFKELHQNTKVISEEEGYQDGDIVIVSLPYVGDSLASGYGSSIDLIKTDKDITLIILFIKNDLLEKDSVLKEEFISSLHLGRDVYIEHFTKMTSDREIPLQTSDMMKIMDVCSKVYKEYQ